MELEQTGMIMGEGIGENLPVQLGEAAKFFSQEAKAAGTRRAYRSDWDRFSRWCLDHDVAALPGTPETVALYLAARANEGAKVATITRSLSAINEAHRTAGHDSPGSSAPVRLVMQGIRRTCGIAQRQKAPVLVEDLRKLITDFNDRLIDIRDRALLALGFAGAFRRSELVGLDVSDLAFTKDGIEILIRRSKTDQEGAGQKVGIPYGGTPATCPVRAVRTWLDAAGISEGPVFRSVNRHGRLAEQRLGDRTVARVVQRRAEAVGLDPARYGGHSLRSGLATSAAKAGKAERIIMRQGRWRSVTMARRYIQDADLFSDNAAAGIGL